VVWSCLLGALGVVTLLGYVWVRIKVVEAGYRLSATRQLVERLEAERMELEARVAAAGNPARLAQMASRRLQMHKPGRGEEANLPR
jgi:cell division protein FtsL